VQQRRHVGGIEVGDAAQDVKLAALTGEPTWQSITVFRTITRHRLMIAIAATEVHGNLKAIAPINLDSHS
jgi:hypothetical protein